MGTDNPISDLENEFRKLDSDRGWIELFSGIRAESLKNKYTTKAAAVHKNKNLNRYRDVSPYDHSRIVLSKGKLDYINANLVKIEKAGRHYILTQGPLPTTTGHFWLMIWEQKSEAIIMLNRIIEYGQEKCYLYWPMGSVNGGQDTMTFNDVGLEVTYVKEDRASYYTTRVLKLTDLESGESRIVLHFHYTAWPDFRVPQSPASFLRFLSVVRRSGTLEAQGPAVVHCSAGIGRSGTFCLVDSCLVLMKENGNNSVDVRDLLLEMRKYRMGLVQTHDQLRFSYLAIIEGMRRDWDNVVNDNELLDEDENQNCKAETSSSSDDEPPPLPPREDSLQIQGVINPFCNDSSPDDSTTDDRPPAVCPRDFPWPNNKEEGSEITCPPDRPLPSEPSTPESPESPTNYHVGESIRKRKYEESNSRTAAKLAEMKKKQEAAEKRSIMQPFNLGLGAFLVGGGAIALYFYFNR